MTTEEAWGAAEACDGNRELISRVVVDGQTVSILGLGLILQELWALGEKPGAPALRPKLMKMVQTAWHDRPPEISQETFMHVLLKEYAIYWGQR